MEGIKFTFILGFMVLPLGGCGGGGDDGYSKCDIPLSVEYVDKELTTESLFVNHNIKPSNTQVVHENGNQGKTFDILRVILSNISATDGKTRAFAYSVFTKQETPANTYMAFYLNTDGNIDSGFAPGTMGAERLVLDHLAKGESLLNPYYTWNGVSWVAVYPLADTASTASYLTGCTRKVTVYVPWYADLGGLDLTDASMVMMLTTFSSNDPAAPDDPIDQVSFPFSYQ